jgi:hypothetical protein
VLILDAFQSNCETKEDKKNRDIKERKKERERDRKRKREKKRS